MDKYSLVDMPSGDAEIKQQIESFQQFYVNKNQRKRKDEWSTKALRIRFLASLTQRLCCGGSNADVVELITQCRAIEQSFNNIKGDDIPKIRKELLALVKEPATIKDFRDLKGKPLPRVFWQVLTPENIKDIGSLCKI